MYKLTHVQAASNAGAFQWLLLSVLFPSGHQTGHFMFGEIEFSPTKSGQVDIGDLDSPISFCVFGHQNIDRQYIA